MAGGWAVAEVKLAECMSRIEGATALGLYGACKLYLDEEWIHQLTSYGIFGIRRVEPATRDQNSPRTVKLEMESGPPMSVVKSDMASSSVADEKADRPRLPNLKREPDITSAGSSTTLVSVEEPATAGNAPKKRKTELAKASNAPRRPPDACQCAGACGSRACVIRRNAWVRQKLKVGCPNATQLGSSYCSLCECTVHECTKPNYRGRWCKLHSKHYDDDGDTKSFSTPFVGKVAFPDTWPVELRLVAKFNYVLPLMIPMDFTVLIEWTPDQLSPYFLVAVFLAQSLKWPPAVRVFYEAVRKVVDPAMAGTQEIHGSTKSDDPAMADAMVLAYRSAIIALNGVSYKEMFDRMNSGLMHAQTGLAVQGTEFGLLSKQSTPRLGEAVLVLLGPAQTQYHLAAPESEATECAKEIVVKLLEASREAGLTWPTGHESGRILGFCDDVLTLTKKFRTIRCNEFGFKGGAAAKARAAKPRLGTASAAAKARAAKLRLGTARKARAAKPRLGTARRKAKAACRPAPRRPAPPRGNRQAACRPVPPRGNGGNMYKVRSFVRVILSMLAIINPACFCEMTYGQLVKFCPDQRELTVALEGMLVGAVERLLNVNPLLIACWTCLFGGIRDPEDDGNGKKMKQLLAAFSLLARRAVEDDWHQQVTRPIECRFPIGPRALAAALTVSVPPKGRSRMKARPAAANEPS